MAIPYIGDEEAKAVYDQVKSGWISMGRRVQELEAMISEYTGAKYTVA
ncbi:MAG: DegT/DnrJ/EryC1/StrS family aminotransferase, partial [Campylobacterota bacterium]